eukprot:scaffold121352_cov53-Attheya_sp.AAC.3
MTVVNEDQLIDADVELDLICRHDPPLMETKKAELEGLLRLSTDAVRKTTRLVETVQSRLDWFSALLFPSPEPDRMGGIAGYVYKSIHAVNDLVEAGISTAFKISGNKETSGSPSRTREVGRSILNGVIGDYLQAENNPLAIGMEIRANGIPQTDDMLLQHMSNGRHILLLIHGSCGSDLSWECVTTGNDYGTILARELKAIPLYVHYNSGLHISENGKALAFHLNRLAGLQTLASDIQKEKLPKMHVLAYSMGGLLIRSACHYAQTNQRAYNSHRWLDQMLHSIVFLGTPHHGALLERCGKRFDRILASNSYTEPFSWIGKVRSQGVMDLGYGNIRDEDWKEVNQKNTIKNYADNRLPTPLPTHIQCFAIAGIVKANIHPTQSIVADIVGDGLVSESSALGKDHPTRPELNICIPTTRRKTIYNVNHDGLLKNVEVLDTIRSFLMKVDP